MSNYVKVSDIWEVLDEKAFNKDDEIFHFAKGLIQWVIDKRAVPAVPLSVIEGIKAEIDKALLEETISDNRQQISDVGVGLELALNVIDRHIKEYTAESEDKDARK